MRPGTKAVFVVLLGAIFGCSSSGIYHQVRSGETLYRISKSYGVSLDALVAANHLSGTSQLRVGQQLRIPGAETARAGSVEHSNTSSDHDEDGPSIALSWPIGGGVVTSSFGERAGSHHDGIDVSAPAGTAVLAAQDGEVMFSDVLRGYGNLVILRHRSGFSTVYAHNQLNLVRDGQSVRRGDVIARVGTTGHASGANLHFEVRKDNVARNPLHFLPPSEQVAIQNVERGS